MSKDNEKQTTDNTFDEYLEKLKNQSSESLNEVENAKGDGEKDAEDKLSDSENKNKEDHEKSLDENDTQDNESNDDKKENELDLKHIRHSAYDELNDQEDLELDIAGRTRLSKGKQVGDELLNSKKEDNEEELSEEEIALEELRQKKEQEDLEKKIRQEQFKEADRKASIYRQHAQNAENYRRIEEQERLKNENANKGILENASTKSSEDEDENFIESYLKDLREKGIGEHRDKDFDDDKTSIKDLKRTSKKSSLKENDVKNTLNKPDKKGLLDSKNSEVVAKKASNEAVGVVKGAGPTMGQDSSASDEAKKRSNAKRVGRVAGKVMDNMAGKEITLDGVTVQLVGDKAKSGVLDAVKGTSMGSVISHFSEINDKKTSEDNVSSALKTGVTFATKKADLKTLETSADRIINNNGTIKKASNKTNVTSNSKRDDLLKQKNNLSKSDKNEINTKKKLKLNNFESSSKAIKKVDYKKHLRNQGVNNSNNGSSTLNSGKSLNNHTGLVKPTKTKTPENEFKLSNEINSQSKVSNAQLDSLKGKNRDLKTSVKLNKTNQKVDYKKYLRSQNTNNGSSTLNSGKSLSNHTGLVKPTEIKTSENEFKLSNEINSQSKVKHDFRNDKVKLSNAHKSIKKDLNGNTIHLDSLKGENQDLKDSVKLNKTNQRVDYKKHLRNQGVNNTNNGSSTLNSGKSLSNHTGLVKPTKTKAPENEFKLPNKINSQSKIKHDFRNDKVKLSYGEGRNPKNILNKTGDINSSRKTIKLTRDNHLFSDGKVSLNSSILRNTEKLGQKALATGKTIRLSSGSKVVLANQSGALKEGLSHHLAGAKNILSENAGLVGSFVGQLSKPSNSEDNKEQNPSNIAKAAKNIYDKKTGQTKNSLTRNFNTNNDLNTLGKKPGERHLVEKDNGSMRFVREGHKSGVKEIKGDSPGILKRQENENLTKSKRNVDIKGRVGNSGKEDKDIYRKTVKKNNAIKLDRKGQVENPDEKPVKTLSDKLNSRNNSLKTKLKDSSQGKTSNIHVGRSARVSTKGGALTEHANNMKEAGLKIRNFWSKNGVQLASQTGQTTTQTNIIAKVVAKKAVATAAVTGISAGAVAGGSAALKGMGTGGDFSVIAASVYDNENDEKALTQDAVDMLEARFKAYAKLASGKKLTEDEIKKAGGNYTSLVDIGLEDTYNGKPVTSSNYKFKFVDRDGKNIDKDKFLLDDYSDLVFPGEGTFTGSGGGLSSSDWGDTSGTIDGGTPDNENTYPVGQCTWGVKKCASWVGNYWGNANMWSDSARAAGLKVGNKPKVGAVIMWPYDGGGYGHVAYIYAIEGNTIRVKESNYAGNMSLGDYRGAFDPNTSGVHEYIYPPGVDENSSASENSSSSEKSDSSNKTSKESSTANSNSSGNSSSSSSKSVGENGTQMDIMLNMIGANETGGQVYGQRDYSNFINAELGAEVTATLGWSSFYGTNGKNWLQRFKSENPDLFKELDSGGQVDPVLNIEWEASRWQANPTQKASIINMLTTDQGKKLQDTMTAEREAVHWKKAAANYTDNMRAVAWYTQIAELAGEGTADAFFDSLGGNYDSDYIYNTLITTWNRGGATIGAPIYHRRHALYKEWIDKYYSADEKVDVNNIEVTGAGSINASGSNAKSSSENRSGQMLLIREILAMSAIGSHYGQPNSEEDYFKYCIDVMDNAIKGKDGNGITITYTENEKTASAKVEFKVLSDLYELEKLDTKFTSWDVSDETYGDKNPQAYMALPKKDLF